jgi:hypothetical protein
MTFSRVLVLYFCGTNPRMEATARRRSRMVCLQRLALFVGRSASLASQTSNGKR